MKLSKKLFLLSAASACTTIISALDMDNFDYGDDDLYDDLDYNYDDLYEEFKDEIDTHEHKFEEEDTHGHHAKNIEEISKKDFKDMNEEERLFYRFKEADLDDNDQLDGLELYHQIFKFRHKNFKETQRRFRTLENDMDRKIAEGVNKHQMSKEQKERNTERLNQMREDMSEEIISKHADGSLQHLDKDLDGIITWVEYRKVVGAYLDKNVKN